MNNPSKSTSFGGTTFGGTGPPLAFGPGSRPSGGFGTDPGAASSSAGGAPLSGGGTHVASAAGRNGGVIGEGNLAGDHMVLAKQSSTQVIGSNHLDYIHRVVFDVYGRRMATCSGDRLVRVFDLTEQGDWTLTAQWQAHRGSVTSLAFAHPEFGSILATCGSDYDAKIWEQSQTSVVVVQSGSSSNIGASTTSSSPSGVTGSTSAVGVGPPGSSGAGGSSSTTSSLSGRWITKAALTESRRAVNCLQFAPRHWGLKLAVGSADGCVRIYEAVDIMNLAQWPLAATLQAFTDSSTNAGSLGCTCLSWCQGRFEPPTLVVGGSPSLYIYKYSEQARAWQVLLQLPNSGTRQVFDVAWAPNVGRRFHYIAAAEEKQLRIYKLSRNIASTTTAATTGSTTRTTSSSSSSSSQRRPGTTSSSTPPTAASDDKHLALQSSQIVQANAWRCQWNVTGTVLASSGDGGMVQLWKADSDGHFGLVSRIQGDLNQVGKADETKDGKDGKGGVGMSTSTPAFSTSTLGNDSSQRGFRNMGGQNRMDS